MTQVNDSPTTSGGQQENAEKRVEFSDEQVQKIRDEAYEIRGLSGRCEWQTIDDLPLSELQKASVLEWVAQKLGQTKVARDEDIWTYGKSYDPLYITGNVAHSYVIDMHDGGRHHNFKEMKEVEAAIFGEFFATLEDSIAYHKSKNATQPSEIEQLHATGEPNLTNPKKNNINL